MKSCIILRTVQTTTLVQCCSETVAEPDDNPNLQIIMKEGLMGVQWGERKREQQRSGYENEHWRKKKKGKTESLVGHWRERYEGCIGGGLFSEWKCL